MSMQRILQYVVYTGLFLVLALPLVKFDSLFFPYITGKNFAFRIIVEIVCAAWVVLALAVPQYRPKRSWVLNIFVAFVGVVFLADLTSIFAEKSLWSNFERMDGFVTLIHLLAYFVVLGSVGTSREFWVRYMHTSLGVAALVGLYGAGQLAGLFDIQQGGVRIDGTFGNAIYMAVYLLFHIFIAGYCFVNTKVRWQRALYASAAALFVLLLFGTGTRGTVLGLVCGIVVTLGYLAFEHRRVPGVRNGALAAVALAVVLAGVFYSVRDTAFVRENTVLSRVASISLAAGSTRFQIWDIALAGAKDRPLLGWGQESFNYVFNTYYEPSLFTQEQWFDRVHNAYLDWLIAAGVLGLAAYLALVAFAAITVVRSTAFSGYERAVLLGLGTGYLVHNFFVFDNLLSYVLFACILALIYARTASDARWCPKLRISHRALAFGALPLAVGVLCVTLYAVNVPHIRAAHGLVQALGYAQLASSDDPRLRNRHDELYVRTQAQFADVYAYDSFANQEITEQLLLNTTGAYSDPAVRDETRAELYSFTDRQVRRMIARRPLDARAYTMAAIFYRAAGEFERARDALVYAHELSPRKQTILIDLGLVEIELGEHDAGLEHLRHAYELDTSFAAPAEYYLAGAIRAGETDTVAQVRTLLDEKRYYTSDVIFGAYVRAEQYDAAREMLDWRIAAQPSERAAYIQKAQVLYMGGDTPAAVRAVRDAVAADPSFRRQGDAIIDALEQGTIGW